MASAMAMHNHKLGPEIVAFPVKDTGAEGDSVSCKVALPMMRELVTLIDVDVCCFTVDVDAEEASVGLPLLNLEDICCVFVGLLALATRANPNTALDMVFCIELLAFAVRVAKTVADVGDGI